MSGKIYDSVFSCTKTTNFRFRPQFFPLIFFPSKHLATYFLMNTQSCLVTRTVSTYYVFEFCQALRLKKMKMKLATILLLFSTQLVQITPEVKRETEASFLDSMVQSYITEKNFERLCDLINRLQNFIKEAKDQNDRKLLEEVLEDVKKDTQILDNFHCQTPVISSAVNKGQLISE